MANKRVFVAFAVENEATKNLFTGQAKNKNVPYDFVDMSAKQPWDDNWKANCRSRIKGCDGVIILVSPQLRNASGALWEIDCAIAEKKKIRGIYIDGSTMWDRPTSMTSVVCKDWTWENVKEFIETL